VDLREADYPWLRRQMGVVMQDNYLFDGSIRANIAAGKPTASMAEVMEAAQLAGAHEFILELDEGYDTKVGERGAGLSGGQRQRIAIARALLTNPRILIFDEATSALDYESERIIMKNLEHIAGERTMLIIAHRLVTVAKCDRIIVVDHGHIAEQGTHEELIALGGIYKKLYEQQEVEK
jgi:subfamily B ATP-binding cassette protein HlyB/CyaB